MSVKWEEPENAQGSKTRWAGVIQELDARPGEWALVGEDVAASSATHLRLQYPDHEFTNRGVKRNRAARVYGRRKPQPATEGHE